VPNVPAHAVAFRLEACSIHAVQLSLLHYRRLFFDRLYLLVIGSRQNDVASRHIALRSLVDGVDCTFEKLLAVGRPARARGTVAKKAAKKHASQAEMLGA
jgi:hypothetical protein